MNRTLLWLAILLPITINITACNPLTLTGRELGRENIACGELDHSAQPSANHPESVTLTAWSRSDVNLCNMASIPYLAAQKHPWIGIDAERYNVSPSNLNAMVDAGFLTGTAPDIFVGDTFGDVLRFVSQDKIMPLEECLSVSKDFEEILAITPNTVKHDGRTWAIPLDVGYQILFFDKVKLKELGWTDESINSLSKQIQDGMFTLDDLLATAEEAIMMEIVEPGFGFIPETQGITGTYDFLPIYKAFGGEVYDSETKDFVFSTEAFERAIEFYQSLFDRKIRLQNFEGKSNVSWFSEYMRTDALAERRALFWLSGSPDVSEFDPHVIYGQTDSVSSDYLNEIGISVYPSGIPARQGAVRAFFDFWVVNRDVRENPLKLQAACQILAASMSTDATGVHLRTSGRTAVTLLPSDIEFLSQNPFQQELYSYRGHAWTIAVTDVQRDTYLSIFAELLEDLAADRVPLNLAKTEIIRRLNDEFGSRITIRS